MKFWQKAYILTLALFLLALNGGIAVVLSVSRQKAFEAECESLLARQHIVAQSLAEDAAAVEARRPQALPRLGESYAGQYRPKGIFLRVAQGEETWADTLPQPDTPLPEPPPAGQRLHTVRTAGQRRFLYVLAMLPAPPEGVSVVCAFEIEDFFVGWARIYQVCFAGSAVVSVLMAGALYGVLRGLSRPMERLAVVAGRIAEGDYAARSGRRGRYQKDEVGQLSAALDAMAARVEENIEQLREAAERKQQLVDNVAHELRTPLTAVRGYAEYIQRAELTGEERFEAAQYIVDEAGRLAAMSERLLQMAALRGEKAEQRPVSVAMLLERAARTAAPRAAARGVTVSLEKVEDCTILGEEAKARLQERLEMDYENFMSERETQSQLTPTVSAQEAANLAGRMLEQVYGADLSGEELLLSLDQIYYGSASAQAGQVKGMIWSVTDEQGRFSCNINAETGTYERMDYNDWDFAAAAQTPRASCSHALFEGGDYWVWDIHSPEFEPLIQSMMDEASTALSGSLLVDGARVTGAEYTPRAGEEEEPDRLIFCIHCDNGQDYYLVGGMVKFYPEYDFDGCPLRGYTFHASDPFEVS